MTYKRTINKFNRGEVDENFLARDDVERIVDTSSQMENMLPIRLGPMPYRPGTQHLGTAQTAEATFTVPFLVSGNASVELEFFQTSANPSVEGFRVWNDGVLLTRTGTADTITNGDFATDLTGWTDGDTGSGASIWSSGAMALKGDGTGGYGRRSQALTVTVAAKRTIRIVVDNSEVEVLLGTDGVDSGDIFSGTLKRGTHSLTFTPAATPVTITLRNGAAFSADVSDVSYESAGTFVLSGSFMPDTSTDALVLPTLKHAQSADVMFLWTNGYALEGRAHPMLMVERRGDESWSLTIPEFTDGPFGLLNNTQLTLAPSGTTGDISLVASLPLFMDDTWIGRSYKIVHAAVEGVCIIYSVTDSLTASARVTVPFGATTATVDWYPGRFSEYQPGPSAGALFDGRLWMGGAGNIDGSVSDAYTSFDGSLEGNSKAISKTIGFGPVQQVQWMWAGKNLLIGTETMEIRVASNDFGDTLTQDNCRIVRVSGIGSSAVSPQAVNEVLYLVQRAGTRVFEISNVTKEDGADTKDMMLLHPKIGEAGIVRIGLTMHPEPRIFAVLDDGTVICCLADKTENVVGWTPLSMEDADILDVSVIPDNAEDEVYFVVQRDTTKYIERLSEFAQSVGGDISRHYDSNVYEATPGTSITGLGHLNGLDVYVWADGREYGPYEVAAGAITVPTNAWVHSVTGVKHIGRWVSNRLGQYVPASVLTDRKRVTKVGLVMRDVALSTILYGDGDEMYPIARLDIDQLSAPNLLPQVGGTLSSSEGGSFTGVQDIVRGNGYIYMLIGGEGPQSLGAGGLARLEGTELVAAISPAFSQTVIGAIARFGNTLFGGTGEDGNLLRQDSTGSMPASLVAFDGTSAFTEEAAELGYQNQIFSLVQLGTRLYGATGTSGELLRYSSTAVAPSLSKFDGTSAFTAAAAQHNSQNQILSLHEHASKLYGATGTGGALFELNEVSMAWAQVAPQIGAVTRINGIATLAGELYGAANDGRLLKWNGTNAWEEAAAATGSYVNAKQLVEYDGKLWAILCEAGLSSGKLHHFTGSAWADTTPATPTTVVNFLSVYANRLFALVGTGVVNALTYEYVGTATYTSRSAAGGPIGVTSFLIANNYMVVGTSAGAVYSANGLSATPNFSLATGMVGASAVMALAEQADVFYAADSSGRLFRDTSGATGTFTLVATVDDGPTAITALQWFGGDLYAGLSTP